MPKFNVEKSIIVNVPVEKAFNVVGDFHTWPTWSPWIIAEPGCRVDVSPDGKKNSWDGEIIGSGNMVIESLEENKAIHYTLTFLKPWKAVSPVSFLFEPQEVGLKLTWTMEGSMPFFLFFMTKLMKAFVGRDYERGLSMLKDYLETGSVPSRLDFVGGNTFEGLKYVGTRSECSIDAIGKQMSDDFQQIMDWSGQNGIQSVGPAFSICHRYDMVKNWTENTAGISVESIPNPLPIGFVSGEIPRCDVYSIKHTGPYRHLGNAWAAGMMRARSKQFKQDKKKPLFELYHNNPAEVSENDLSTTVNFPVV